MFTGVNNTPPMSSVSLGYRNYQLIGRLLAAQQPEVAKELLTIHEKKNCPPRETDHGKLNIFFVKFCEIRSINPLDHSGPSRKTHKISEQRFFVAVMLHLYYPQFYTGYMHRLEPRSGFVKCLSQLLKQDRGNISKMIREVVAPEKVYEDFQSSVQQIQEGIYA